MLPATRLILFQAVERALFSLNLTKSIVPEFAFGPPTLTFTRATAATGKGYDAAAVSGAVQQLLTAASGEVVFSGARRVSEGVWSAVLSDESAISTSTLLGYLSQTSRINIFTRSSELSHADWTKNSLTISNNTAVAPDGTTTMDTCTPTAGAAYLSQSKTISSGAKHVVMGHFKQKDADPWCALFASDGATSGARAWFNLATGAVGTTAGFGAGWSGSDARIELVNGVYECSFVVTPTGTTFVGGAHPSVSGDNTVLSTVGRANYAWGLDCQAGVCKSTHIPTPASATVTRNASVLQGDSAGNLNAAAMTIGLSWTPQATSMGTVFLWGTYVDASNYTAILHDGTNVIVRKRISGANHDATKALTYAAGTTYRIVGRFDGVNGCDVWVDGTKGTNDNTTTACQIGTNFQIGADGNNLQQAMGALKNFIVHGRTLPDAAAAVL